VPHRYQMQDSPQTLAEGLAEYYAVNAGRVTRPEALDADSVALFRSHDICHVIFGLDTTLADETLTDARTLLSCDVGARRYARYLRTDPSAKALFKELGVARALWSVAAAAPRIGRAMIEAWRTPRQWPWDPPADFQERRLGDLRRAFRITVI
jgi:hypothetical protein